MSDQRDLLTPEELAQIVVKPPPTIDDARAARRINTSVKGKRGEREVVGIFEECGVRARRQPRSGSIEGLPHDVIATLDDGQLTVEVKRRKTSGWKVLEKWRDGADVLVLIEDQTVVGQPKPEPRVYMSASTFRRLLRPHSAT